MAETIQPLRGGNAYYTPPSGPMVLGEAPIYRASDSTLHWVDCLISPPTIHILRIDPLTGSPLAPARVLILSESVSVIAFRQGRKGYIGAYYAGVCFIDEITGELEIIKEIIPPFERGARRFNDGGIDAKGRFWLAEIDILATHFPLGQVPERYGERKGRLWRYDPDGSLHLMVKEGLICGNGVDWSLDDKIFYLNDSMGQKVMAYDFDLESGEIANMRVLVDFRGTEGEPDGMVVDTEGNLWIAVYGSNTVKVYTPEGKQIKEITFSGKNLTCPTWGGKNLDLLFVTSGRREPGGKDEGGSLFMCKIGEGVRGRGKNEFAG